MQLTAFTGCSSDLTSSSTYASRHRHRQATASAVVHDNAPMHLESPNDFFIFWLAIATRYNLRNFFTHAQKRIPFISIAYAITTSFIDKKLFIDKRIFIVLFVTVVVSFWTKNLILYTILSWRYSVIDILMLFFFSIFQTKLVLKKRYKRYMGKTLFLFFSLE